VLGILKPEIETLLQFDVDQVRVAVEPLAIGEVGPENPVIRQFAEITGTTTTVAVFGATLPDASRPVIVYVVLLFRAGVTAYPLGRVSETPYPEIETLVHPDEYQTTFEVWPAFIVGGFTRKILRTQVEVGVLTVTVRDCVERTPLELRAFIVYVLFVVIAGVVRDPFGRASETPGPVTETLAHPEVLQEMLAV
jgi:hypothetical protein